MGLVGVTARQLPRAMLAQAGSRRLTRDSQSGAPELVPQPRGTQWTRRGRGSHARTACVHRLPSSSPALPAPLWDCWDLFVAIDLARSRRNWTKRQSAAPPLAGGVEVLPEIHTTRAGGIVGELANISPILEFDGLPRPEVHVYGREAHDCTLTLVGTRIERPSVWAASCRPSSHSCE